MLFNSGLGYPVDLGVDASGNFKVGAITLPTTIYNGQNSHYSRYTCGFSTTQAITSGVKIKALSANTGSIFVGNSSVSSSNGFVLKASEEVFLEIDNLATVYLDSSVNGEGASYIAT
jgi:hypothetical protein